MAKAVSVTNKEMAGFYDTLTKLTQDYEEKDYRKFKYAVAKTLSLMKNPIDSLRDKLNYKDPLGLSADYNKKYQEVFNSFAVDKDGEPFFTENPTTKEKLRAVPAINREAFEKDLVAVDAEFKDLVEDIENHQKVATKVMAKKETFSVFSVDLCEVPESLPQVAFNVIHIMITAEEE